ncbi:MAG: CDP-glycerol glycerophosphotransferase family protein [Longimicrobiales bacterium]
MKAAATAAPDRAAGSARRRPDASPPVVFMGVPMAINVRDILRTDAFDILRGSGARIHLFTPAADVEGFRREFGGDGVSIHPLRAPDSRLFAIVDVINLKLQVALLSLRCDTARIMIGDTLRRSWRARAVRGALALLGRRGQDVLLGFLRRVLRATAPELYAEEFRDLQPDLVVGTRVLTMSGPRTHSSPRYLDRHLLLSAARRRVRTMVLVSSWDNLTTSGFFPVDVDCITVWNEIMRDQAMGIHGLRPDQVVVTGAPQHDTYAGAPYTPRHPFWTSFGLDPDRPVVVYTTGTSGTIPREPDVVARLEAGLRAAVGPELQLLIRVHQLDSVERYTEVAARPGVVLDHAGRPPVGSYHDRDFDQAALRHLADTLHHADVVVNAASSISIDAAAVGTPVVCVDFDAEDGVPYHRSVSRFYDFTHQRPVVASGGVVRARTPEEVVEAVHAYLADPALHAEGRARLVREQCHAVDGGSGRRVGAALLDALAGAVSATR